jgi:hypothetical protein
MRKRVVFLAGGLLSLGVWFVPGCWNDPPPSDCTGPVTVFVAVIDTVPIFSWRPDCTLGRLTVIQGPADAPDEYWGTETCGTNTYDSPIRYAISPVGTCPEEPARPLERGLRYTVQVWRFYSVQPESLQLVGSADFDFAP